MMNCEICGYEMSPSRALECYQKKEKFVCESCDEKI